VFRSCILWSSPALAVLAKLSNLPFLSASIAVVFLMCVSGLIATRDDQTTTLGNRLLYTHAGWVFHRVVFVLVFKVIRVHDAE
jgi:hypothetical protein